MIELKGKNACITGSSRGAGQQIAMGLANLGCNMPQPLLKMMDQTENFFLR